MTSNRIPALLTALATAMLVVALFDPPGAGLVFALGALAFPGLLILLARPAPLAALPGAWLLLAGAALLVRPSVTVMLLGLGLGTLAVTIAAYAVDARRRGLR